MADPERRARRRANLRRLLCPRHVAFIGGRAMEEGIEMLRMAGFEGEIWPVNPKYDRLAGLPVHACPAALPEAPDAAFLHVPRALTAGVLEELADLGAGGAVCFAAGYAETSAEGRKSQEELASAAGDLAVFGPNSNGFLNCFDRTALWPVTDHRPRRLEKGVAVVSSSGGVLFNYSVSQRSLEAGVLIGLGNQAVCDFSDCLDVLADDPRITAIGLFMEDFGDIPAFSAAAAKALSRKVPVVAMKTGASEQGAMVARTHSGALACDDRWADALFERCGVIRVRSLPELDETLKMMTATPLPKGPRLAVLTNSGGEKAMAADAAAGLAIDLVQPSPETRARLAAVIPDFAVVSNPFDYNAYYSGSGRDILAEDNPRMLELCFRTMVDDGYDIAMMLMGRRTHPDGTLDPPGHTTKCWIAANRESGRAIVQCSTMPEHLPEDMRRELIDHGVAPLQGLKEAMTAIDGAVRWGRMRAAVQDPRTMALPPVPPLRAGTILLDEGAAREALAAAGLPAARHEVVAPAGAGDAARRVGCPVAVKAALPVVPHKAQCSAVTLGVASPEAAVEAAALMAVRFEEAGSRLEAVMVEAMVADPLHEFIVGVSFDGRFGHALLFGRGGSNVERDDDVALCLLPASRSDLERTVRRGARDDTVTKRVMPAVEAVARYAGAHRESLVSLDINPLIVTAGGDAVAVDVVVEFVEEGSARS